MKNLFTIIVIVVLASCSKNDSLSTDNTGKNGSVTRFAIKDNLMYAIDFNYLSIYNISNNDNPVLVQSIKVAYGLETIYIYGDYVYLGSVDGVYVIDIKDPAHPHETEKIEHHLSCDPVVVQNNYAYSTQRVNATGCGSRWHQSALAVYDVSQPLNSVLVKQIMMAQPYGLAVEGNWLYVCDPGKGGIVVYDISNPADPQQMNITSVTEPRDIITFYPYMIVSTTTKFEIYNYADPLNIYFVSSLALS
jgi:hypothetical protein